MLDHLKISQKFAILIVITLLAFMTSQGFSLITERSNSKTLQHLNYQLYPAVELTTRNQSLLQLIEFQINSAVTTGDDQALNDAQGNYEKTLAAMKKLPQLSSDFVNESQTAEKALKDWYSSARSIAEEFMSGNVNFAEISEQATTNAKRLEKLHQQLKQMNLTTEDRFTSAIQSTIDQSRRANQIAALIAFIAIFTLASLSLITSRSITGNLARVSSLLKDMNSGQGDLTTRIQYQGKDEIRPLVNNFNQFIDKLHQTFGRIATDIQGLSQVSTRLTSSSTDNFHRIQEQSTAIASTHNAIQELMQSVHEVARFAADASNQAQDADQAASEGKQVLNNNIATINSLAEEVGNTSEAVNRFGDLANNVGHLLKTIQDVAEQTNLLALNAAIEAARAGDHGRGFAVVADEVRVLAVRTSEAADEIYKIIKELGQASQTAIEAMQISVQKAEQGVEATTSSATTLEHIISNVGNINGINEQIAAATHEQSSTFESILQHVQHIHSNAEQVTEETSRLDQVSQDIDQITRTLTEASSQFRV
ncbi:methyl-accepting chemotaxis protein [Marinospirillum celere]|uniref:Methyl-accepting chemotaxis protein n=1 Tax=Marinospirillum celere TaxID=1122252 RepID=A0A1I1IA77_9GAMM|nr:methyl-accepting chemotaxis protein [Marinospirillum celere]SFC33064.1 methyl-accepting chemotaxis protein [Marinospirillum celere]